MVFEKNSRKIHVFSLNGNSIDTQILESWPNAIGALESDKIFCSYYHKLAKEGIQLGLFSRREEVIEDFINLQKNMEFVPTDNSFYANQDRLFHVPTFADSAIVFKKDSVEKTIHFVFEDKFITEEIKNNAYKDKLDDFYHFKGVQYINTYYETSRFHYLKYVCDRMFVNHLIDKKSKKQYKFISSLIKGLFPSTVFCVRDNKLLYIVTKQDVEDIRHLLEPADYIKVLSESDEIVKKIFKGEETLPLILSIEIKE